MEVKKEVIEILELISSDSSVPKNVKQKIQEMDIMLKTDGQDMALSINKILQKLDDLNDENNLPEHIRTQIWNMASLLESII